MNCFHSLVIVNRTVVSICVQVFVWTPVFNSFRYIPRSGIAGSPGNSLFNFWGTTKLFSTAAIPFYIPTNLYISTCCFPFIFYYSHASVKWCFIVVLICISLRLMMLSIFSCASWVFIYVSLEKCLFKQFSTF